LLPAPAHKISGPTERLGRANRRSG